MRHAGDKIAHLRHLEQSLLHHRRHPHPHASRHQAQHLPEQVDEREHRVGDALLHVIEEACELRAELMHVRELLLAVVSGVRAPLASVLELFDRVALLVASGHVPHTSPRADRMADLSPCPSAMCSPHPHCAGRDRAGPVFSLHEDR